MSETRGEDEHEEELKAENWWEMVPGRKQGGAKLLKRCIELLSWRVDFAMNVLGSYRDFLECKVSVGDFAGTQLEPSLPIYQMWSQHILDTKSYTKDCELLFGKVLHHDPDLYRNYDSRQERVNKTMRLIYERKKGGFVDPVVWHFGPAMGNSLQHYAPSENGFAAEAAGEQMGVDLNPPVKRPRVDGSNEHAGYSSQQAPPSLNQKFYTKVPIPSKIAQEKDTATVTLQIFKGTDGGVMDNKVTLKRDQQLRTVLDYFRYRCIWQNRRLNLHYTPDELRMGKVENVILSSIHVDESITLWFRDYKGGTVATALRMRETIGSAIANHLKEQLDVDESKVVFSHRGTTMSATSTPIHTQLDHGDLIDITLVDNDKETEDETT